MFWSYLTADRLKLSNTEIEYKYEKNSKFEFTMKVFLTKESIQVDILQRR